MNASSCFAGWKLNGHSGWVSRPDTPGDPGAMSRPGAQIIIEQAYKYIEDTVVASSSCREGASEPSFQLKRFC